MNLSLVAFFLTALLQAQVSGFRISGRVLDGETGKPIVNAVVTLTGRDDKSSNFPPRPEEGFKRTVTIGADGLFQFTNVPRGPYRLHTEHPNPVVPYRGDSLEFDLTADLSNLGLVLSPAVSRVPITGKVVVVGGQPLPSTLSAISFSNDPVTVQRDGSFQTRLRPAQHYEVTIQNAPEGFYVESVSGGTWNALTGSWVFRDNPHPPIEVVLGVGRLQMSGRVLDVNGSALPQATVTLLGPLPAREVHFVTLNAAGTFSIGNLRSGDYELRAKTGTGEDMRAVFLPVTMTTASRASLDLVVRPSSQVAGQVVVAPPRTVAELVRFDLAVEINDAMGTQTVRVDSKGTFQFRSFEPDYALFLKNLPVGLRAGSISKTAGAVVIRLETILGDDFPGGLRFDRR